MKRVRTLLSNSKVGALVVAGATIVGASAIPTTADAHWKHGPWYGSRGWHAGYASVPVVAGLPLGYPYNAPYITVAGLPTPPYYILPPGSSWISYRPHRRHYRWHHHHKHY
jgi:hypothetical protein